MIDLLMNLSWLLDPDDTFTQRIDHLARMEKPGAQLRSLASLRLNLNQLTKLHKRIAALRESRKDLEPLVKFRLGILSNSTTDFISSAIVATGPRFGLDMEVISVPFGQAIQAALDPESDINRSAPDAVLLALDYHALFPSMLFEHPREALDNAIALVRSAYEGTKQTNEKLVFITQNIVPPPESIFGSLDSRLKETRRSMTAEFNSRLCEHMYDGDLIFDVESLANSIGLSAWHDPKLWHIGKFSFSPNFVPLYADHLCRMIAALKGLSRRCLILDLDNTLWGGVIGDDGLSGIVLGQGDPIGEAYLDIQSMAMALRERGVVLAVSSKNDDSVARAPFRKHPEMLLKEEHLAVFQANWIDKASNIRTIADTLNLGLNSMVFVDDNPAERAQVRRELPEVAVPHLPESPADYPRVVLSAGYFESVAFSEEDKGRAKFYQENQKRMTMQSSSSDIGAYLASLQMEAVFSPFEPIGRSRIVQLINKSNQFNLTTRRYNETEITRMESDEGLLTMQVRLLDTFGDNGMISVVIGRWELEPKLYLDTWLMSCRVLGRRLEETILQEIVAIAKTKGIEELIGEYIPTDRNGMVAEHYSKLGFIPLENQDGDRSFWGLKIKDYQFPSAPITVKWQYPETIHDGV